jgi:hypothetical protein
MYAAYMSRDDRTGLTFTAYRSPADDAAYMIGGIAEAARLNGVRPLTLYRSWYPMY